MLIVDVVLLVVMDVSCCCCLCFVLMDACVDGVTYLFLDSEGLGALSSHSSQTFDVSIFTLSVLLASLFVLNTTVTNTTTHTRQTWEWERR